MVLELAASRLVARHLGSSLYTWTAVIGVILSGITIGNYLGGRVADKFNARKAVALLFIMCSASCVLTIILNNLASNWIWLWYLGGTWQIFCHIFSVFIAPSILLGMISPVVAKMALTSGLPTGRTIGDIYAWGAAGSIAGTFTAGYWLIAAVGTQTIIWIIGTVLLVMGVLYWHRFWFLYIWKLIFIVLLIIATVPAQWAESIGKFIAIIEQPPDGTIYEDESRYCHIVVCQDSKDPNRRHFLQDKLKHSEIMMNDIFNLQYNYTKIYDAVTEGLSKNKPKLNVMVMGGGGYVYPRYVEKVWPGSRIDVIEIDPAVTKAAMLAFGLPEDTTINTINMDARNYVDQLIEQSRRNIEIPKYDFIYEDAINDYSVPFQLVTREFNEKIYEILKDDGIYMINMIDIFDSGLFLGSIINTLEETFSDIHVVSDKEERSFRSTFVVIASKNKLDVENIFSQSSRIKLTPWLLSKSDITSLKQRAKYLVLTDDYSPVENLLAPVVCKSAKITAGKSLLRQAGKFRQKGKLKKSIATCLSAVKLYPESASQVYNEIGIMYAKMNHLEQAAEYFTKSLQSNYVSEDKIDVSLTYYNLGLTFDKLGKPLQAKEQFLKSADESRRAIAQEPTNPEHWRLLGKTFIKTGDLKSAIEVFNEAVALDPNNPIYYDSLIKALEQNKQFNEAVDILKKEIQLMQKQNQDEAVLKLQQYLKALEIKKLNNI